MDRTKFLGGTDSAKILGLSRYGSPLSVWAEKTGMLEPVDISDKLQVKLGVKLEDAVAELFTEQTGKIVNRANQTIFHKQYPFLGANIDRRIVGEKALLEVKTTSAWKKDEWNDDQIPAEYICQCLHYLAVTGYEKAYIACLIGNEKFVWKEIVRDEAQIKAIVDKEVSFWTNFVQGKVQPEIITSQDTEVLNRLYPRASQGTLVELGDDTNRIIESIEALKADKKTLEKEIDKLSNTLKAKIKENEFGETGLYTAKWINIHKDEHTVKASDYRQLRYSKKKEA